MDKRLQIIEAGMKLFVENDIQATPMSAIAKEAGTGMGTIYNYFATKEELINEIYLFIKQKQLQHASLSNQQDGVKPQFLQFAETFITFLLENPACFYFIDQIKNSPILTSETKLQGLRVYQPFLEILVKGQQQGIIKNIDIEEILHFLDGGLMGFLRWAISNGKCTDRSIVVNHIQMAWDSIKS
ncbi:TetR/AcrR family transcriptional regulator [Dyadobacter sp. CY326]|uniref:TetR/AcrR family transcriptional regulator n=1 Tax=Dyadobacter sp. CY326 TaxID=2907300 RepID=UPI001F173B41|nr:TetR/AcrR family transcriptional regulator [Dyadobacter sp. CY326]MCE7065776.1 TetR/AcrR family transcriptional regulator [Dyadobacter sp. CY326]